MKPQGPGYWVDRKVDDPERDWTYGSENWVEDYVKSKDHPHRGKLIEILKGFEWSSLLELGCNAGPNLLRIHQSFPEKLLCGADISLPAIEKAEEVLPKEIRVHVRNVFEPLPYLSGAFDVILADAVLMYAKPEEIERVIEEMCRIGKTIIIIDRFNDSPKGVAHYVWARNYTKLLEQEGKKVKEIEITKELWPSSENWAKHGRYFIGQ